MDRQTVVYPCNEMLSSNKKGPTTDISYGMDEPQKHYVK